MKLAFFINNYYTKLLYNILYEFDHHGHAHVNHDGEKEATAYYFDCSKKYNINVGMMPGNYSVKVQM